MTNLYSIGEVSKIKDITIKALRYYHKMGILVPKHIDESSGYRYYTLDQFIYIDIIKGCRALGTSIEELQAIFKQCDTNTLVEFLQQKKAEAQENILKMQEVIKNIEELSLTITTSQSLMSQGEVTLTSFKERKIILVPCTEAGDLREVLYYSTLDKIAKTQGVELTMERGLIYDTTFSYKPSVKYAFSTFEASAEVQETENIKVLPAGNYLTLTYNKANEKIQIKKLMKYLQENHTKLKFLLEVELFNDLFNTQTYSCQLQAFIGNN